MSAVYEDSRRWSVLLGDKDLFGLPYFDPATIAGISVAIVGNVLISFALNCQKLAHRRLELQRQQEDDSDDWKSRTQRSSNGANVLGIITNEDAEDQSTPPDDLIPPTITVSESEPLISQGQTAPAYGSSKLSRTTVKPPWYSRISPWRRRGSEDSVQLVDATVAIDVIAVRQNSPRGTASGRNEGSAQTNESDYLKSKLWYACHLVHVTLPCISIRNVHKTGGWVLPS